MTLAEVVLVVMWLGVTAYAVFAGADFGAGFWDLVAGGARRGLEQRRLIEHSIGPVWEANHVWLIFALVIFWTAFPTAFAAVTSTLYLPLTAAAIGIILRGAAFAFRKAVTPIEVKRVFGATFALSSVLTPFFLGAVAGAVASGRVPPGVAQGGVVSSWWNPTSVLGGTLAVLICAYLAAVFLAADAARDGEAGLARHFRGRALTAAVVTGPVSLAGIAVLRSDAPELFDGLTGRALPLVAGSALFGLVALWLVWTERFAAARLASALAVATVVWGWAAGQYPFLLQGELTIDDAAAPRSALLFLLVVLVGGSALVLPALAWLVFSFSRGQGAGAAGGGRH
ncbi:MAG: cytochrome d ubiquinol oxidase subunit II [Acidimicrobiales bacterium]